MIMTKVINLNETKVVKLLLSNFINILWIKLKDTNSPVQQWRKWLNPLKMVPILIRLIWDIFTKKSMNCIKWLFRTNQNRRMTFLKFGNQLDNCPLTWKHQLNNYKLKWKLEIHLMMVTIEILKTYWNNSQQNKKMHKNMHNNSLEKYGIILKRNKKNPRFKSLYNSMSLDNQCIKINLIKDKNMSVWSVNFTHKSTSKIIKDSKLIYLNNQKLVKKLKLNKIHIRIILPLGDDSFIFYL